MTCNITVGKLEHNCSKQQQRKIQYIDILMKMKVTENERELKL